MAQPKSQTREVVETLLVTAFFFLLIVTFVGQSFVVDGASMQPTLHDRERLIVDKLSYRFRAPERGEIVVFHYPANPKRDFVKRIIGLPGDTVAVHDQHVWLNGVELTEPYTKAPTYGVFPSCGEAVCPPVTIQPDHYFVMGDNRNNSEDSRFEDVGQVPRRLIIGRAILRFWPPTRPAAFFRPATVYEAASNPS